MVVERPCVSVPIVVVLFVIVVTAILRWGLGGAMWSPLGAWSAERETQSFKARARDRKSVV